MPGPIGEAFVVVKPLVGDFRGQVQAVVAQNLGSVSIPIPVAPQLGAVAASQLTWQKIAGGAVVPVAMPVSPIIAPAEAQRFRSEVGGLRGLLLGGSQFGASRALGIGSAAAGLFLFGKAALAAVKSAATLQQNLQVFQQVSGATADQMKRVADEARALGADIRLPGVSSGDAAATMLELAKAGLSVNDVLKGTRGTLELATAANIDFATASEISADALNAFQLPGAQAAKVADLLAGAANAAQGDISSFGIALAQSAAVAHQAGISVQDTVTRLTELAKAGIQGSDAGTSLRVALLRLIAPTSQAKQIFQALGIQITDAAGNVRTDVFEQLRASMTRLEPATRNAALATIFGTDAVRAAAVFVRDGAAGFDELATQVERQGQAAQTAEARTKGLAGKAGALSSNLETLGTDLGTIVLPLLETLADDANVAVGAVDKLVVSVDHLAKKAGGIHLGPLGSLGDLAKNIGRGVVEGALPGVAAFDAVKGVFEKGGKDSAAAFKKGADEASGASDVASGDLLFGKAVQTVADAASLAGRRLGATFEKSVADGIIQEDRRSVAAARRTLADVLEEGNKAITRARAALADTIQAGDQAVKNAIDQGHAAVAAAALDAKQNLTQIGQTLAQQVAEIADTGPLATRIQQLQNRLNAGQTADQRRRLRKDLKDAQADLARAQAQIQTAPGQTLTGAQQAGIAAFLDPFKEKVKDAKAALGEFNQEGTLAKLQARLAQEQKSIAQTLDGLVARFNAGIITGPELLQRLAGFLSRNVGPVETAGKNLGFAFTQSFQAEFAGLEAQLAEILGGPGTSKTGAEPRVVSPATVQAQARKDVTTAVDTAAKQQIQAQQNLADAKESADKSRFNAQQRVLEEERTLHKDELAEAKKSNTLLAQIKDQLSGAKATPAKPSSQTAKPKWGPGTGGARGGAGAVTAIQG